MNDGPSWIKLVTTVGVPSAIALYLVWVFTTTLMTDLNSVDKNMNLHVQATEKLVQEHNELIDIHDDVIRLLRRICVHTAETNQDRGMCF
jgi:hypothetical protein